MISYKQNRLKSLLESSSGIHLTSYLVNTQDPADIKRQIRKLLNEADEFLCPVMTYEEQVKFLEPIQHLMNTTQSLAKMKGNIGIFRKQTLFRVVNVPVSLEFSCSIATSFHVKPLLRWMQVDRDFLILQLSSSKADLYLGNQSSLDFVKTFEYPYGFMRELIKELGICRPKIYVVGDPTLTQDFFKRVSYANIYPYPAHSLAEGTDIDLIAEKIRKDLAHDERRSLDNAFVEYKFAKHLNLTADNIFTIAKEASQGKVLKLIVADELKIYGKIDNRTGRLTLHPFDLDHEDDDVLDDLAQTVLMHGGQVIVAPRKEMLEGRAALAILDHVYSIPDVVALQQRTPPPSLQSVAQ